MTNHYLSCEKSGDQLFIATFWIVRHHIIPAHHKRHLVDYQQSMFPANTRYGANDIPDMAVLLVLGHQDWVRNCKPRAPGPVTVFLPLRKLIRTLVVGTTPFFIPSRNGGMEIKASSQLHRIHVGGIRTKLSRHAGSFTAAMTVGQLVDVMCELTQLYAVTVPDGTSLNGKYQSRLWARIRKPRADTASSAGKELWTWLEEGLALRNQAHIDSELGSLMVAAMAEHQLNDLHMTAQQIMKEVDGLHPHQGYMLGSSDELLMS
ncbi:hypothetical protein BU15DRAFT_67499 [Melanogaster broomeanus]|nr:hypothetical protein BU15DRAFT_67499 [Melanogaster broomeanus]